MNRRGFTLLELMISLTVGGIAITSIYAIGATATRTFHQQQQIAAAQTSLRNAVNQVKRDVARAGYLFTPVANPPGAFASQTCAPVTAPLDAPLVSGRLAAIARYTDDVPINAGNGNEAVDPTGTGKNTPNGFTVDEIVLFGNYETASEYGGVTLLDPNTIAISANWQAFRRDFSLWPAGNADAFDEARFSEAFAIGRVIRIQTTRGQRHFATITSVTAPTAGGLADVQVAFTPAVPLSCDAEVTGGWVAPISAIRYHVRDAPAAENERFANSTGRFAQLVRTEVDPGDKVNPLASLVNSAGASTATRAVLDYVVGFNLAFTMNGFTNPGEPDNYVAGSLLGNLTDNIAPGISAQTAVNANPERVRSITIEIAVRSQEVDARMPFNANCSQMRCFQVFPDSSGMLGTSRVRRERAEVFLPNVAYEGY